MIRKVIEAWLTPQIALLWQKKRVLEVYLNIIEFGPGIYGADAAANRFFDRSAARHSRAMHAVRLAVVLPDPLHWSAAHPSALICGNTQRPSSGASNSLALLLDLYEMIASGEQDRNVARRYASRYPSSSNPQNRMHTGHTQPATCQATGFSRGFSRISSHRAQPAAMPASASGVWVSSISN